MAKKDRTMYCGNLHEKVSEELLYELFLQAGPLESVKIPPSKNFGFITFKHDVSVPYAVALMQGLCLFGRDIRLELRTGASDRKNPYLERIEAHKMSIARNIASSRRQHSSPYPGWNNSRDSQPYGNSPQNGTNSNGPLINRSFSDSHPLLDRQMGYVNNYGMINGPSLFASPIQLGYNQYPIKDGRSFQDRNRCLY